MMMMMMMKTTTTKTMRILAIKRKKDERRVATKSYSTDSDGSDDELKITEDKLRQSIATQVYLEQLYNNMRISTEKLFPYILALPTRSMFDVTLPVISSSSSSSSSSSMCSSSTSSSSSPSYYITEHKSPHSMLIVGHNGFNTIVHIREYLNLTLNYKTTEWDIDSKNTVMYYKDNTTGDVTSDFPRSKSLFDYVSWKRQ